MFQVTVAELVPAPAVMVPAAGGVIVHVHPLMPPPDWVVYMLPVDPTQAAAAPAMVGTGRGFTVTFSTLGAVAVHPNASV